MTDKDVFNQALLGIYDRIYTGRPAEAFEMFLLCHKVDPTNETALLLKDVLFAIQMGQSIPEGIFYYFGEGWKGEDLTGKSIQIVCDQGMGDVLNLLRFVKQMKDKWGCRIVLNCYAHFDALKDIVKPLVDEFTAFPVKCDYHTNLMSIPSILAVGHVQYPPLFKEIIERELPPQVQLGNVAEQILKDDGRLRVGVVFSTNKDNVLSVDKSIPVEHFKDMPDRIRLISLSPSQEKVDFIEDTKLNDLWDTAAHIKHLDIIVSVDTVVLHLAGLMGKPTYGLLHTQADPRWGTDRDCKLYPSVYLLRQEKAGDWIEPMGQLRQQLVLDERWRPYYGDE